MNISGQHHNPPALPPGTEPMVPIGYEDGWAPKASLEVVVKRKIPSPCQDSNTYHPTCNPVLKWQLSS